MGKQYLKEKPVADSTINPFEDKYETLPNGFEETATLILNTLEQLNELYLPK